MADINTRNKCHRFISPGHAHSKEQKTARFILHFHLGNKLPIYPLRTHQKYELGCIQNVWSTRILRPNGINLIKIVYFRFRQHNMEIAGFSV